MNSERIAGMDRVVADEQFPGGETLPAENLSETARYSFLQIVDSFFCAFWGAIRHAENAKERHLFPKMRQCVTGFLG